MHEDVTAARDPIPVRMLNEYAYCPRLFHLMHIEGRWADNEYTVEGSDVHRRVDRVDSVLPLPDAGGEKRDESGPREEGSPADGDSEPTVVRSLPLSCDTLGLTGKLDLVAFDDSADPPTALPVESKRGRVPDTPDRSYEPERVQLMAQGLLLRAHGFECNRGVLYFAASRTRVDVPFTAELEARTRELLEEAHAATSSPAMPDPLEDSPKCVGCSLAPICLPDETLALRDAPPDPDAPSIRRLYPMREKATPLYVQEQGARISRRRGSIVISDREGNEVATARLRDVSQLVLCGNVRITTQTIHRLCEAGVPVVYLSTGNWFYGITHGLGLRNAFDRAAQFRFADDAARRLALARQLIADKGANQRALLRRNGSPSDRDLTDMAELSSRALATKSVAELLGIEGMLARIYFRNFASMLRPRDLSPEWAFETRNRRPPRDPVNAMLSFAYALLTKECTVALLSEGLEPHWGIYHQPRHGRPALSLDLMEPLRPLIADSAVLTAINTGMIRNRNFKIGPNACLLEPAGRKALISAYEARLDQLVTHPVFDYRCSWRSAIRLHARLLARHFRGDVPRYASIVTR